MATGPGRSRISVVLNAPAVKQTPVPLPHIPRMPSAARAAAAAAAAQSNRGRPKGWKPGMSYAEMRGKAPRGTVSRPAKPKPGQVAEGKRRGRPPRQESPPPRQLYLGLRVPFLAFLCEWEGCRAELHNLETLRRHVGAVHVAGARGRCGWGARCREGPPLAGGRRELEEHVEERHLVPLAWHVGDGPRNTGQRGEEEGGGDELPAYLLDGEGRQVTPSVRHQEVEDYVTWRNNRRRLRELLAERDKNLPSEDDDEDEEDDDGESL